MEKYAYKLKSRVRRKELKTCAQALIIFGIKKVCDNRIYFTSYTINFGDGP